MENFFAAGINNEATTLEMQGNFPAAEAKYLQALQLKRNSPIGGAIAIALTMNALGELYLKMGRLDDAEKMLKGADGGRSPQDDFDCACTRDNIGRLYEMKGDVDLAKEWRLKGANNGHMICSNFDCPKSRAYQFSKRSDLNHCAKCKCAFYCGRECQKQDWKRHKEFCKKGDEEN
ncbi:hypothetical protein G7Y89_g9731 [Cudoniella acicularis]|uniref:MYND-type domain-containing protein n=1 Tax=Cudoniella acicularis TaxID=354080 RepID=A0A8H4RE30_9HELO|nr:hypothetical protein G7Y89_g9731 [Cudoniella acicularis]